MRISAPESILTYRLPQVLRIFRRRFPNVEIAFVPSSAGHISELESGKLDLILTMCDTPTNPQHKFTRIRTERIFLFGDPSHPLASSHLVKPSDIAGYTLLLTESGCGYRAKFDRALALHGVRPGIITEFSSIEAMKQCVRVGMGLAVLPAIVIAREIRQSQFKALHWGGPSLDIESYVIWHKDKWVSPAMAAFLELVQAHSDESTTAA